jgi:hypothetical protein
VALIVFPIGIVGALILLFVGSALLRAAAVLANKTIGPVRREEPIGWDWDADEDDEDPLPSEGWAIPEPTSGQGMRILFLAAVGNLFLGILLQYVLREEFRIRRGLDSSGGLFLMVIFGFLILSTFIAWLLPTTFRRGALVAFFSYLILLGIVAVVASLVYLVVG